MFQAGFKRETCVAGDLRPDPWIELESEIKSKPKAKPSWGELRVGLFQKNPKEKLWIFGFFSRSFYLSVGFLAADRADVAQKKRFSKIFKNCQQVQSVSFSSWGINCNWIYSRSVKLFVIDCVECCDQSWKIIVFDQTLRFARNPFWKRYNEASHNYWRAEKCPTNACQTKFLCKLWRS